MNNIRNEVQETQLKLNHFALHKNSPLTLQVWKKTPGLALGERFSAIVKARLESVEFLHTPTEPIIGRVKPWPTDTLKKAQLCPEEYKDLIVRIGGYTDYFTGLSPEMQSEVIQRTVYKEF